MDDGHAAMNMGMPSPSGRPAHGTWPGHVLPGSFFLIWSSWWLFSIFRLQLLAGTQGRQALFRSHAWYSLVWGRMALPVEPLLKVALTSLGILAELWAGHTSYRRLYAADGRFEEGNLQDWQHAAMYGAFLASGLVDLLGHYCPKGTLPPGLEHAFLGVAFGAEGTLFAFHLKGTHLDWTLHLLLVTLVYMAAAACFAEYRFPGSVVLAAFRAQAVMLQGIWFIQIAQILFKDKVPPAWDPSYHGSAMMVPVVFVTWVLGVLLLSVLLYVGLRLYWPRRSASCMHVGLPKIDEETAVVQWQIEHNLNGGREVEIAAAWAPGRADGLPGHGKQLV